MATPLIPGMTSATNPSGVSSASSELSSVFAAWVCMRGIWDQSTRWITNGTAMPAWLQYQFDTEKVVNGYTIACGDTAAGGMAKSWRLLGSNTGAFSGEETVLDAQTDQFSNGGSAEVVSYFFTNTTGFTYFRLADIYNWGDTYLRVLNFQLYNLSSLSLIPKMTSANTPSGVASENDLYASGFYCWNALDWNLGTVVTLIGGASPTSWLKYEFPTSEIVTSYSITTSSPTYDQTMSGWKFQGSNDDSSWTDLDEQTGQNWAAGEVKTYSFTNTTSYKYYRLLPVTCNSHIRIAEWELFKSGGPSVVLTSPFPGRR